MDSFSNILRALTLPSPVVLSAIFVQKNTGSDNHVILARDKRIWVVDMGSEGNRKIGARLARSYPFHPRNFFPWCSYIIKKNKIFWRQTIVSDKTQVIYRPLCAGELRNKNYTVLFSTTKAKKRTYGTLQQGHNIFQIVYNYALLTVRLHNHIQYKNF
jgi:hypothetical protein